MTWSEWAIGTSAKAAAVMAAGLTAAVVTLVALCLGFAVMPRRVEAEVQFEDADEREPEPIELEVPAAPEAEMRLRAVRHMRTQTTVTYTALRGVAQPRFAEQQNLGQLAWHGGVWLVESPAPVTTRTMATQSVTSHTGDRFQELGHREHGVYFPNGNQYHFF